MPHLLLALLFLTSPQLLALDFEKEIARQERVSVRIVDSIKSPEASDLDRYSQNEDLSQPDKGLKVALLPAKKKK